MEVKTTRSRWEPRISRGEWYVKWALENWAPCEGCPTEYREAYAKLEGAVEAADSVFQKAYGLYQDLESLYEWAVKEESMRRKE